MRKVIISVVILVVVAVGYFMFQSLTKDKKKVQPKVESIVKTVFADTVANTIIPITIKTNGNLVAKSKVELYSEVQGVLQMTGKDFKPGVAYKKGQTILKINSDEFYASIQSQRSSLENLIASIMPDIRLDYSKSFQGWDAYLKSFDINKTTPKLPKPNSNQEKLFVTAKNIYSTYYIIKNLEQRLAKYYIKVPYDGVVTEANVTKGALVRSGQKLGEFIDPSIYELEVAVNAGYADILKVGKVVGLQTLEKTNTYSGKVVRVNSRVDQSTQSVTIYIQVKGENLQEGMYLEANVSVQEVHDAYEVSRHLLVNDNQLYLVKNNTLTLATITPVYFNENTVVVKGLNDGDIILSQPSPGAYVGQEVTVFKG